MPPDFVGTKLSDQARRCTKRPQTACSVDEPEARSFREDERPMSAVEGAAPSTPLRFAPSNTSSPIPKWSTPARVTPLALKLSSVKVNLPRY